ncbi:MAG: hypothetical protein ABII89_00410 [Candidatus Omnitrophota bacterium]
MSSFIFLLCSRNIIIPAGNDCNNCEYYEDKEHQKKSTFSQLAPYPNGRGTSGKKTEDTEKNYHFIALDTLTIAPSRIIDSELHENLL